MTAEDIKKALIIESEHRWNPLCIIDEFEQYNELIGGNRADIYLVKKNRFSVEVEIKTTPYDLMTLEPKKGKWLQNHYEQEEFKINGRVPNYFYFAMPFDVWESCSEFIIKKFPFAGVLVCSVCGLSSGGSKLSFSSFKKCKLIHSYPVPSKIIDRMCQLFYWRWRKLRLK